jgi:hypothetical protein
LFSHVESIVQPELALEAAHSGNQG